MKNGSGARWAVLNACGGKLFGCTVHRSSGKGKIGRPALINMETAVKECKWTFLVLTPHWIDSQWTLFEGLMQQHRDPTNLNKGLLPLMLEKCNLPDRLSLFTYADFTEKNNWETQLGRLLGQMGITYTPGPVPGTMVVKPVEKDVWSICPKRRGWNY